MLECVLNVSEGRDRRVVDRLRTAAGDDLLDVHADPYHHRAVLTVVGEGAPRAIARVAVELIDVRVHHGVHPRIGAVDVVPFVPLDGSSMSDALTARDGFCAWAATELALPCFRYGPGRTLPEIRRDAFTRLAPDTGPSEPHPSAGACAVGARPVLVAYNLWLADADLAAARRVATEIRSPAIRALGLRVGDRCQVSMNLVDPLAVGPADAWDLVAPRLDISDAELVGLVPEAVLARIPPERWGALDLDPSRTIESRLAARAARRA